jgi:hypothetical protein
VKNLSYLKKLFESLHLKNHQNFKGDMNNEYSIGRYDFLVTHRIKELHKQARDL